MKVGITGHQDLGSEETISWLSVTLENVIPQYGIDLGITSLAIGSDQLFTEILRKSHIQYIAVLQTASTTIKLPFDKPTETAFYEAGKRIVQLSDMMIAIWNGLPAKGLGGTGDIVKYALSIKKPVVHLNPITQIVREISRQDKQTIVSYDDLIK